MWKMTKMTDSINQSAPPSLKWRMTETKYKKLRNITVVLCLFYLITLSFLVKYAMKVNPSAFIVNSLSPEDNPFVKIEHTLWIIVMAGWVVVILCYVWVIYKDRNHWFWSIVNSFQDGDEDNDEVTKNQKDYIEEDNTTSNIVQECDNNNEEIKDGERNQEN